MRSLRRATHLRDLIHAIMKEDMQTVLCRVGAKCMSPLRDECRCLALWTSFEETVAYWALFMFIPTWAS